MSEAVLIIRNKGNGAFPGTLRCVCGHTDLARWTPDLGAFCDACARAWNFKCAPVIPPEPMAAGVNRMVRNLINPLALANGHTRVPHA